MIVEFVVKKHPDVVVKVFVDDNSSDDDLDLVAVCGGVSNGKQIECCINKKFATKKIIDAVYVDFIKRYFSYAFN